MTTRSGPDRTWAAIGDDERAAMATGGLTPPLAPGEPGEPDAPPVIDPFGLTATEQAVARGLLRGEEACALADRLGLSVLGVRLQIKGLYAKLAVHTKGELLSRFGGRLIH